MALSSPTEDRQNRDRKVLVYGAACMATGVAIGAFGAHGLRRIITDPAKLNAFEVGVRYQLFNGVGLLALGALPEDILRPNNSPLASRAPELLLGGTVLFSGSLYGLALAPPKFQPHVRWLGPVTPVGGLIQILGWAAFAAGVVQTSPR